MCNRDHIERGALESGTQASTRAKCYRTIELYPDGWHLDPIAEDRALASDRRQRIATQGIQCSSARLLLAPLVDVDIGFLAAALPHFDVVAAESSHVRVYRLYDRDETQTCLLPPDASWHMRQRASGYISG